MIMFFMCQSAFCKVQRFCLDFYSWNDLFVGGLNAIGDDKYRVCFVIFINVLLYEYKFDYTKA